MRHRTTDSSPDGGDGSHARRTFLKTLGAGAATGLLATPVAARPGRGRGGEKRPASGQVTILHDTHLHGHFGEAPLNIAYYFGLLDELDAPDHKTITVGNGDDLASSLLSSLFDGEHITDAFNAGDLDYDTFGNHDFDMGPATNRDRVADSDFTWVSANLLDDRTGDVWAREVGARRYVLQDLHGITVGITGVINEEAPQITNLGEHATVHDIGDSLDTVVPQMRAAGADVVVVSSHVASTVMEEILPTVGADIDAVVGDHAAEVFEEPKQIDGTLLSAVGDQFEFVGELTLNVNHGSVVDHEFTLHSLADAVADGLEPDPAVYAVMTEYQERVSDRLDQPIGATEVPLDTRESVVRAAEANTGNYIADTKREWAGADVGLMNGGGIRTDTLYFPDATASDPATVTARWPQQVMPFGNTVVVLEVTGEQLRAALENGVSKVEDGAGRFPQVSGMTYTWNPDNDAGNRIVSATVGGDPLDDGATYSLATNNFVSGGGDGYTMFQEVPRIVGEGDGPILSNLVRDAIDAESPIAPTVEGRITETTATSARLTVPASLD